MREIKFRAWDKKKNIIRKVYSWVENYDWTPHLVWFDLWEEYVWWDEIELMQFTWLTDKKWVEVYEGDLIKWIDNLGREFIHPVSWEESKCMFILESENFSLWIYKDYKIFEVVWNIHSNPELLTKK